MAYKHTPSTNTRTQTRTHTRWQKDRKNGNSNGLVGWLESVFVKKKTTSSVRSLAQWLCVCVHCMVTVNEQIKTFLQNTIQRITKNHGTHNGTYQSIQVS